MNSKDPMENEYAFTITPKKKKKKKKERKKEKKKKKKKNRIVGNLKREEASSERHHPSALGNLSLEGQNRDGRGKKRGLST